MASNAATSAASAIVSTGNQSRMARIASWAGVRVGTMSGLPRPGGSAPAAGYAQTRKVVTARRPVGWPPRCAPPVERRARASAWRESGCLLSLTRLHPANPGTAAASAGRGPPASPGGESLGLDVVRDEPRGR
jgi:hypothetical protein